MFDKIYTVGCFDYFHQGHINLLTKMKEFGKTIIVGIHDDYSIRSLKNLNENQHKTLLERIKDLKPYCDKIFIIAGNDPTPFLEAYLDESDNFNTSLYIRADDYPNFPGRELIEKKMNIMFLPYTKGISSTLIRKKL